ncbi:MAG: hypothetical protein ACYDHT_04985, partial [Solirubrobacteraceae bacterium]
MHALPFLLALVSAAILAPSLLRALTDGGHVKTNYRGRSLPFPFGVLVLAAALLALIPTILLDVLGSSRVFYPEIGPVALYSIGVIALGLIDDTLGEPRAGEPIRRGWRGHGAAVLRGELSTGVFKAVGSLGLALLAMAALDYRSHWRWLLAAAVLVLATNVFNLLDLRPGRSVKAFVLLGLGLGIGSASPRQLWTLGLFAAPALVAGLYDLRERAMLGDTGANLLGALAGLWLVLALS